MALVRICAMLLVVILIGLVAESCAHTRLTALPTPGPHGEIWVVLKAPTEDDVLFWCSPPDSKEVEPLCVKASFEERRKRRAPIQEQEANGREGEQFGAGR